MLQKLRGLWLSLAEKRNLMSEISLVRSDVSEN
jgi:hypothetical protein